VKRLPDGMREKVLNAAELFAESGLDATKMEDVAAATGVPKATLYYYFEGKEDILAFLFSEILEELENAVAIATSGEGTAAERLRKVITAHIEVVAHYPAASRALQFDLGRAARIPHIADRIEGAYQTPVRDLLDAGAEDGSLRRVAHPRTVATAILGAVSTVGVNTLTVGENRRVERVIDDLLDFIMTGLEA
jgi:TetR/AcrR family transcriptional regulator